MAAHPVADLDPTRSQQIEAVTKVTFAQEAQRLMRLFMSAFKNIFKQKIGAYWIGPAAFEFLRDGGRLTLNVNADPSFDIQIPNRTDI